MYRQRLLKYEIFVCTKCHKYFYDEGKGDRARHVPAGTLVDNLPEEWQCPVCGAGRENMYPVLSIDEVNIQ